MNLLCYVFFADCCKIYSFEVRYFSHKLLLTTLTELNAIAAPAIIGFNKNPLMG